MTVETFTKSITLEQFWEIYPDGYGRYELYDGVMVEMQPTGTHEQIAGFLAGEFFAQIREFKTSYIIPRQAIIKPIDSDKSGYSPDVIVVDSVQLKNEPFWQKRSTITEGKSVKLVVEVVSTNWRDDYGHKLVDYEALGIEEYWIVDYLGLGGKRYIGEEKLPTISLYILVDGEYNLQQFRDDKLIVSPTFPDLKLTANQIFSVIN
ncbi:Uma2 family endonuclease [Geminocystis sp. CENA526]|uniref:Uma2 family endonuclease n=1 Tax=Geminocystis sp. CENA526 TaxID=1355871 RepID=UPI003D6DBF14